MILVVGNGFSNSLTQYDDFAPGGLFRASQMEPFCFTVNGFDVQWLESGPRQGMARGFQAPLTYRENCSGDPSTWSPQKSYDLKVNHPLTIGGTQIFLIGHGYAPVFKVTDGTGHVVFDQAVPFIPVEQNGLTSEGVVKVPDAEPDQLGFAGVFLPTAVDTDGQLGSGFPAALLPRVSLVSYAGNLGLDPALTSRSTSSTPRTSRRCRWRRGRSPPATRSRCPAIAAR